MWGEDSPLWTSKVMGEFPEYAQDTVVPLPMVRRLQAWETWPEEIDPVSELGIDVGAGGDKTVIRHRFGRKPGKQWTDHTADPSNVVSKAMQAIRETGATRAKIDSIGIGWGVAGWLEEKLAEQNINCEVIRVNVGEGSSDPWRFPKLRDEIWWMARELTQDKAWDLRDIDDETLGQLIAPKYKPDTAGRTKVEKKEDTRERIGRSPDNADALNLAFYEPPRVVWSAA
jgi:hypothetical protein